MDREINIYKSITSPLVLDTITLGDLVDIMRDDAHEVATNTKVARLMRRVGVNNEYNEEKKDSLTTTLNFLFNGYRKNNYLVSSTGLLYFDVDDDVRLYHHPLIFISGLSFSGTGRFYIVKTDGIDINNYHYNIQLLKEILPFEFDKNAMKPNQQMVITHNPALFINYEAKTWIAKNTQFSLQKRKGIDRSEMCVSHQNGGNLRFSNIDEILAKINFDGDVAWDAVEPIDILEIKYPPLIKEGSRNSYLNYIGYNIRVLNPHIQASTLYSLLKNIANKNCVPRYPENELKLMVKNIIAIPPQKLKYNPRSKRRIFFNPDYDLSGKDRKRISQKLISRSRTNATIRDIRETIENWDFDYEGKITQKKIAKVTGKNINTIGKNISEFKDLIKDLNADWKKSSKKK